MKISGELTPFFDSDEGTFRSIFQSSNEGILVVNSRGVIQTANPVGEKMFGYKRGELISRPIDLLIPVSYREKHSVNLKDYEMNPSPRIMGNGRDLLGLRKDGSEFPVEISLSNTKIKGKLFVVAFVIDITERKKTDEALKKSEEQLIAYASQLEIQVKKRTKDLDTSIEKLEQTNEKLIKEIRERKKAEEETQVALSKERELNELKSRFVSMASHEFRTPLSSILSSVSLIRKHIANNSIDKTERHVERIKSSVKNLTDILNDFLNLGKLEEGKVEMELFTIELSKFLSETAMEMEGILKPGQYIEVQSKEITHRTDDRLLKNILINLISNASKYSPEDSKIILSTESNKKEIIVQVQDRGMGIPKDEQLRLFERFFRARNAMNIQGTGLGLNIVLKYVDLLGGAISCESDLGIGTKMTIKFPVNN